MGEKTCNDCVHAGEIYAPLREEERMKKYCPPEYLFDHPHPEKCPNFRETEKER